MLLSPEPLHGLGQEKWFNALISQNPSCLHGLGQEKWFNALISQNPWCLHGLGQEIWFEGGDTEQEEQHFSVRPKFLGKYSGLRNLGGCKGGGSWANTQCSEI